MPQRMVRRAVSAVFLGMLLTMSVLPVVHAQESPSITIVSPADGDTVTTTDITLDIEHSGFDNACRWVGLPDADGQGHFHVMIDGMTMATLTNFYCDTNTITLSGVGLEPGEHTIIVDVATNTHMDLMETAQEITIDYQPSTPAAGPDAVTVSGTPAARITNLQDGATLGPTFDLGLAADNFTPSCDLEGKTNQQGFGHYHVFIDMPMMDASADMSMMSMQGMVAMPCDSLPLDLSAWPSGPHSLTVELVQNDHTPIEGAGLATINFTLNNPAIPDSQILPNTGVEHDAGSSTTLLAGLAITGFALVVAGLVVRRRLVAPA